MAICFASIKDCTKHQQGHQTFDGRLGPHSHENQNHRYPNQFLPLNSILKYQVEPRSYIQNHGMYLLTGREGNRFVESRFVPHCERHARQSRPRAYSRLVPILMLTTATSMEHIAPSRNLLTRLL